MCPSETIDGAVKESWLGSAWAWWTHVDPARVQNKSVSSRMKAMLAYD